MKICWDNLERLLYKGGGVWKINEPNNRTQYIYEDHCGFCKEPYFNQLHQKSNYCSMSCIKKIQSQGKNNPFYGKVHKEETKEKNRKFHLGKNKGKNSNLWKGGVTEKNIPLYDTYVHQLSFAEQVRRNKEDGNILEVKCTYCGKWYIPKMTEVNKRIMSLNGKSGGEQRLYCSDDCKRECPIYRKVKYSAEENNTKKYSREVQPELRQMVFKRDNYMCQKCFSTKSLNCHHIEGVELNPIESADVDNCITFCKYCHKEIHRQDGCKRTDYRRKKCKEIL